MVILSETDMSSVVCFLFIKGHYVITVKILFCPVESESEIIFAAQ